MARAACSASMSQKTFSSAATPVDQSLSQTEAEVSATPVNWLAFNALEIVVPQQHEQRELDTGFTIKDGEQRSFSFSNSFLHGQIEQYNFQYQERLNEEYTVIRNLHLRCPTFRRANQQEVDLPPKTSAIPGPSTTQKWLSSTAMPARVTSASTSKSNCSSFNPPPRTARHPARPPCPSLPA